MKNTYQANSNQQNTQFNQRLHHLQGFIGLANWQLTPPSATDIRAYEHKGRQQLAADNQRLLRSGIKQLASRFKTLAQNISNRIKARRRNQHNLRALHDLNDHLLNDIGISRADLLALRHQQTTIAEIKNHRAELVNQTESSNKPSKLLHKNRQPVYQLMQKRPCANDSDKTSAPRQSKQAEQ